MLAKQEYLVGDKPTIADFSFVPWNMSLDFLLGGSELPEDSLKEKHKNFARWHEAVCQHPGVKKMLKYRSEALASLQ